jgi:hypothetical protein
VTVEPDPTAIRHLNEFTTSARQLSRIRAALWGEAGIVDLWWVPNGWHPNPYWAAVIDLRRVQRLGENSRAVIARWLAANGFSPLKLSR